MPEPQPARGVNDAMGAFLDQYPWNHYLTLTFRPPQSAGRVDPDRGEPWGRFTRRAHEGPGVSLDYALRHWRAFERKVAVAAGVPLYWFYGVEYGDRTGRLHLHALTGNTERLPVSMLREQWRAGFSRILQYDPTRGASYYVAKYVTKALADWDISGSPDDARKIARYREPSRAEAQRLSRLAQARLRAREKACNPLPSPVQLSLQDEQ